MPAPPERESANELFYEGGQFATIYPLPRELPLNCYILVGEMY